MSVIYVQQQSVYINNRPYSVHKSETLWGKQRFYVFIYFPCVSVSKEPN